MSIKVGDIVISLREDETFGALGLVVSAIDGDLGPSAKPNVVQFGSGSFLYSNESDLEAIDHIDEGPLKNNVEWKRYSADCDLLLDELNRYYSKKPSRDNDYDDATTPAPVQFNGHVYWLEMGKDKPLGANGLQLKRKCICCNVVAVMVPPISLSPFYPEA